MSRTLESYTQYPSEYDPTTNSALNNYVHPRFVEGRNVPNMDYHSRLTDDVRTELQELVLQSVVNWPQADYKSLISDRTNVWHKDVEESFQDLEEEKIITRVSDIENRFEGYIGHPKIIKLRNNVVSRIKSVFKRE